MRGDDHESGLGRELDVESTPIDVPSLRAVSAKTSLRMWARSGGSLVTSTSPSRVLGKHRALEPPLSTDVDNPGVPRLFFLPTRVVR